MQHRLTFFDIVLFSAMVVSFVIGIHQSIYYGVAYSYWLFMLSTLTFLWLNQRLKRFKNLPDVEPKITDKNQKSLKTKTVKDPRKK